MQSTVHFWRFASGWVLVLMLVLLALVSRALPIHAAAPSSPDWLQATPTPAR